MNRSTYKRLWFGLAVGAFLLGFTLLLVAYITTPRTSDLLPAATATQAVPTVVMVAYSPPATETPNLAFAFGRLGEIDSIAVVDNTTGWGGETKATYALHREGNVFEGTAAFSVNVYTQAKGSAEREITVQPETIKDFLHMLEIVVATPPAPAGTSQSSEPPSDCPAPNPIRMELRNAAHETLARFTVTGCLNYSPWAVTYAGRNFETYSDIPSQALTFIESYMRKDVFDALTYGKTPVP